MKRLILIIHALCLSLCLGQTVPDSALYLGQTPPGNTPKIFQLPVSSGLFAAERIAVSPDEKEIYFSELNNYPPTALRIKYFKYSNNQWNGPFVLFEGYNAPGLSLSGDTLFIEKLQNGASTPCVYVSVKTDTGWGDLIKFMPANQSYKHYLQGTISGHWYLSSNPLGSIGGLDWCRLVITKSDTTIESLGLPLNTTGNDADFYIAKDESYIIFSSFPSANRSCYGYLDLFITYRKKDNTWTYPKNLGTTINVNNPSDGRWGPYVTADNKYLFYSRGISPADGGINWVRIDGLIDSLKHTNFVPYLKSQIPNQTDTVGRPLTYRISDTTFIDDDGNTTLHYTAALSSGSPLPTWLAFDSNAKTFSGIPTAAGSFTIKVTAIDTANATVASTFTITVALPTIDYFGQTPPGDTPIIFASGSVSGTGEVNTLSFSSDGKKMVFTKWINSSYPKLFYSEYSDSLGWSQPAQQNFTNMYEMEGIFAPYGNQMYFAAGDMSGGKWSPDELWMVEKQSQSWTTPAKVNGLNTSDYEFFATQTLDSTIYFQRSTDNAGNIYYSKFRNGSYSAPVKMAEPINVSTRWSYHPCISPDGSYLIIELGNNTNNDLWVSFRNNNTWSELKNLGNKINTSLSEGKATLSPDGKYLFFSRQSSSTNSIYWVSTRIIDSLKHTFTAVMEEKINGPRNINLFQNYPNPFNPTTMIQFTIAKSGVYSLCVFNVLGQEVSKLIHNELSAGIHRISFDGSGLSSGIYTYRLVGDNVNLTNKMLLVK